MDKRLERILPRVQKPARYTGGEYNQIIKEVCEQYGVVCLDNTGIVKEEYYEPDGMHFKMSFYSYWLYSMALGAGMIK